MSFELEGRGAVTVGLRFLCHGWKVQCMGKRKLGLFIGKFDVYKIGGKGERRLSISQDVVGEVHFNFGATELHQTFCKSEIEILLTAFKPRMTRVHVAIRAANYMEMESGLSVIATRFYQA